MNNSFDVIVIGAGSMGSATGWQLARRGYKVLLLDRLAPPHTEGSHSGHTRLIRKAYFEHPDYVPLLQQAYRGWEELEEHSGRTLFERSGLLYIGDAGLTLMKGVRATAAQYHIPLERLGHAEASRRFPVCTLPESAELLLEPDAGYLYVEPAIRTMQQLAIEKGATLQTHESVTGWHLDGDGVVVSTEHAVYRAQSAVVTAGARTGKLLSSLAGLTHPTKQTIAWAGPQKRESFITGGFPCWMIAEEDNAGCYYGFPLPRLPLTDVPEGMKLARHFPGPAGDPDHADKSIPQEDVIRVRSVLDKYFPGQFRDELYWQTCWYANSPDEDFIIDILPESGGRVVVACGFSGHGFKFVPVVGEILADLATTGKASLPVAFLRLDRFA